MHAAAPAAKTSSMTAFTLPQRRARVAMVRTVLTLLVVTSATLAGCSRGQRYELRGQVLAVDRGRQEVTITHEDVHGFMPAMTMPFKIENARLLDGLESGDLVRATLVVRQSTGYLTSIERTGHQAVTATAPPHVDLLEPGQRVPEVQLTDETGKPRTLADWRGRTLAVTFIYTRCPYPDFCPRMDRQFKNTPTVLAAHAKHVGADPRIWQFATGNREVIDSFASRFGVSVIREGAGAESVTHNLRTAVIGPDGTLSRVLNGTDWTSAELIDALRHAH
jgi:protein SCO1